MDGRRRSNCCFLVLVVGWKIHHVTTKIIKCNIPEAVNTERYGNYRICRTVCYIFTTRGGPEPYSMCPCYSLHSGGPELIQLVPVEFRVWCIFRLCGMNSRPACELVVYTATCHQLSPPISPYHDIICIFWRTHSLNHFIMTMMTPSILNKYV